MSIKSILKQGFKTAVTRHIREGTLINEDTLEPEPTSGFKDLSRKERKANLQGTRVFPGSTKSASRKDKHRASVVPNRRPCEV